MAKKAASKRSPKNNERTNSAGVGTIGIRVSLQYAEWLRQAAEHDRDTIAGFLDRAAKDRAIAIGFKEPPPVRIP